MHVITLPETSPRAAHVRSGGRLLVWVARQQRGNMIVAAALGVIWMLGEAVIPVIVGRTIDAGILERDSGALLIGCAVLLTTGVLTALVGVMLHRFSVLAWLKSALLVQRLIGYHLANHGVAVTADTTSGEVAESVGSDASRMGNLFETSSRSLGALVSFPLVAAFVIHLDPVAGLWVAAGLPLTSIALFVVVRPLQSRERLQRKATGRLTALGADTAAGLRVLRGIGGERQFVARYRQRSQEVKAAGLRVARAWGMVEVVRVVVPGLFVVVLIWFGARGVLDGRLSAGELVTLYGSAAYLRIPLDVAGETLFDWISARVASERVAALLSRRTAEVPESQLTSMPGPGAGLADPVSGVRLPAGALTALVSDRPEQADALGERLAGLGHAHGLSEVVPASGPALGGIPLVRLPQDALRSRVQLNEAEPRLFSGTLRSQLDPYERHPDDVLIRALVAADALDVLQALPDGLDTELEERGRGFSGGQRQRLALARALVLDPEVLLLLEPTSAVDAHTEARMAQRLRAARQGRTTLVTTASPLLLQECDQVLFLHAKQVVATGTHRQLMRSNPSYRAVVTRDVQEDDQEEV